MMLKSTAHHDSHDHPEPTGLQCPLSVRHYHEEINAKVIALTHCSVGCHEWQPTTTRGKQQCRVCFSLAYCPGCSLNVPPTGRIVRCQQHQEIRP